MRAVWWSSMSDEEERWRKTKRENNHSGMKGAAAVSLCCTKQSQASSSLSIYLAGKKNREVEEEERRRGREKCWKREWSLLLFKKKKKKKCSPTRVRAQRDGKPKKDRGQESFHSVKDCSGSDVIITRTLAEPEHEENQTRCPFMSKKALHGWTGTIHTHTVPSVVQFIDISRYFWKLMLSGCS